MCIIFISVLLSSLQFSVIGCRWTVSHNKLTDCGRILEMFKTG